VDRTEKLVTFRNEFGPSLDRLIYLNSANLSFVPRKVLRAIHDYTDSFEVNPTRSLAQVWPRLWEVQCELADFFGARAADLFLRENVTAALNLFLLGMPIPAGKEILVGELEYGAIHNVARLRAEREGRPLRVLRLPTTPVATAALSEDDLVDQLVSQIGPRTGLIVLSHVTAGTGLVLPIRRIAATTRARGILLAIDGAYAPGALTVNFGELDDVDFYGCSLYKWMLGPKGTAFGWIPARHHDSLQVPSGGWHSFGPSGPFANFGDGDAFAAKMAMTGCRDFSPFLALRDLMAFWRSYSEDFIREAQAERQALLRSEVGRRLGWLPIVSRKSTSLNGPLTSFVLPETLQSGGEIFAEECYRRGIQINAVLLRGVWAAVFSAHAYNSPMEITEAVARLVNKT